MRKGGNEGRKDGGRKLLPREATEEVNKHINKNNQLNVLICMLRVIVILYCYLY